MRRIGLQTLAEYRGPTCTQAQLGPRIAPVLWLLVSRDVLKKEKIKWEEKEEGNNVIHKKLLKKCGYQWDYLKFLFD